MIIVIKLLQKWYRSEYFPLHGEFVKFYIPLIHLEVNGH